MKERNKKEKKEKDKKVRKSRILWVIGCILVLLGIGFTVYTKHTKKEPENFGEKGKKYLEQKEYDKAAEVFEKMISEGEETEEGNLGIGLVKYEQGDYRSALEAFEKAIQQEDYQTTEVYRLMGICSMQLEDYQKALNSFNLGLTKAEAETGCEEIAKEMLRNEVTCYEKLEDWENACKKAEEYIALYPEDQDMQKEAQFLRTR